MSGVSTQQAQWADLDDDALAVQVARRFYIDDRSKSEIAAELKLSRFKVARVLDRARRDGIVKISVSAPDLVDTQLSRRLQDAYGLRHAVVVGVFDADDAELRGYLGQATADLLPGIVRPEDTLGLGWARSVLAAAARLRTIAPCRVVQLTGSLDRPEAELGSVELVRRVADLGGGTALSYHVPMFVADSHVAAALRFEPQVARAMQAYPEVTVALVGVGGWNPPASTLHEVLTPPERAAILREHVHADISGVFIDRDGRPVQTAVSDRIIGIDAAALRAIPHTIAVAYGHDKVDAVRAAIRGGYVDSLVTHASFAERLLDVAA
ncbi:sugar-binding transcriptional regulator [uncultured Jatrophihabitans sp.]|uniref:sugar-binding transcriptional regulator n=1 Tax=uncultured Jatrophihabitans sp. TaxID=1610747 RepID=UPI0035CB1214